MLYRVSASKDTFITNLTVNGRQVTGSNAGASEILQFFKTTTPAAVGNILIMFPTASAIAAYSASFTGSAGEWHMLLKNVETSNPGVGSCDIEILPLEMSWDEGKGHDIDYWTDKGYTNWTYARNGVPWTNPGARPNSFTTSAAFHFEDGHEDVDVELQDAMVLSSSYGFWIGISSSLVADSNDYYLKAFRSRQTHFPQYAPVLELRWNDATGSVSSGMMADSTGSLVGNIYNLRSVYDRTESPILRTHFQPKDWNTATVLTASTDASGTVLTNGYYRIVDDIADEVVIPFGNGVTPYTKMSYNDDGNYFQFYMSNLVAGIVYRFDIGYYDSLGEWHIIRGDDMKFRVI